MSSEDKSLKEINVSESGKKNNTLKLIIMYFLCAELSVFYWDFL